MLVFILRSSLRNGSFAPFTGRRGGQLLEAVPRYRTAGPVYVGPKGMTMRVLVWAGLLLVLTVMGSAAGLFRMIGMPIGAEFWAAILMLATAVGVLGVGLVLFPEPRLLPDSPDR